MREGPDLAPDTPGASTETPLPSLHVLVSEREAGGADGLARIERLLELAAPVAVHLRARLPANRLFGVGERLVRAARSAGSWLVVNGRPDVALAAGAHAVQLGAGALGVAAVRRLAEVCGGDELAIGASVHDAERAARAVRAGAGYLVLGTIYATPSHPGRAGSGPAAVAAVRRRLTEDGGRQPRTGRAPGAAGGSHVPILAIGGVTGGRIDELASAGAHGIVVGRAVWSEDDPVAAAVALRRRFA